jgi:hypothetical protein
MEVWETRQARVNARRPHGSSNAVESCGRGSDDMPEAAHSICPFAGLRPVN